MSDSAKHSLERVHLEILDGGPDGKAICVGVVAWCGIKGNQLPIYINTKSLEAYYSNLNYMNPNMYAIKSQLFHDFGF